MNDVEWWRCLLSQDFSFNLQDPLPPASWQVATEELLDRLELLYMMTGFSADNVPTPSELDAMFG